LLGECLKAIRVPSGDQTGPPANPMPPSVAGADSKTRIGVEPSGDPFQTCSWSGSPRSPEYVAYAIPVPSGDHTRFGDPKMCSITLGEQVEVRSVRVHEVQPCSLKRLGQDRDARAVGRPPDPGSGFPPDTYPSELASRE
jgi:hypothetical protein